MADINNIISKITDTESDIHKLVCLKAGMLAGSPNAIKFCEYLSKNTEISVDGKADWISISDSGETKINSTRLKELKNEWILDRSGQSKETNNDETINTSELENINKKLQNTKDEAKKYEGEVKILKEKENTISTNISNLNEEKRNLKESIVKLKVSINFATSDNKPKLEAQLDNLEESLSNVSTKLDNYKDELKKVKDELDNKRKLLSETQKQLEEDEKQYKKELNDKTKAVSWWKSNLKSWKQKQLNELAEKCGEKKVKVVPDTLTDEELIRMATWVVENPSETTTLSYIELSKSSNEETKNTVIKQVWENMYDILSIKQDLDPKILEKTQAMTPDAAASCFKGAVSNTFALAKTGVAIINDPSILQLRAKLIADATAGALAKLNTRVTEELTKSVAMMTDITPIVQIPTMAAQEMMKHIWTPADIMNKIKNDMDKDALTKQLEDEANKKLKDAINGIKSTVFDMQQKVGEKLEKYNKAISLITNTLNQSPNWYIDNINKLERKYEKEILSNIQKVTVPALDAKYKFVDTMVEQVSLNLVTPVNQALEEAQMVVLRKIVEMERKAIIKAKTLAAKALMKILGLLGG